MSDLLNQASLVMVPSGYKEDTVYSVVPSDGSGDLSFTRASNGTRINSAGLVEVVPWNLLQQSETFDNATWTKDGLTVTTNTTVAPNGTTTADTLTEGSASGQHRIYQVSAQSTNIYTISVYVKNITGTRQAYIDLGPVTGFFNFASETTYSASGIASFENVGNGWYRFSLTTATAITPSTVYIGLGQSNSETYTGNGTSAIAFWGAQLNIGSTAKPYFPTTDRLNVPRLTYQNGGGGCPSLLLEKQSTNLTLYSDQLDNAVHTLLGVTITANNITSPDGTQNADKITETTANSEHIIYDLQSNSAGVYTLSCFLKQGSGTIYPVLRLNDSSTSDYALIIFDFTSGTVVNTSNVGYGTPTHTVSNLGNGWYRVTMTSTTTGTFGGFRLAASNSATPTFGASGSITYTGSTSNYFYAYGAQLEASSYPTSLINTTSSSATRVADACYKTGISSLIGQTEGVVFIDINRNYITSSYDRYFAVDDADASIYRTGIYLFPEPSIDGRIYLSIRNNNTAIYEYTYNNTTMARLKVAMAYKSGDIAYYINGTQVATSSATFTFAHTLSRVLSSGVGQSINEAVIFPTRLTNAELASLTTI
jgi:hypothetical protein